MNHQQTSLKVIAYTFVASGMIFALDSLYSLLSNRPRIQLFIALLPLGIGLLSLNPLARKLSAFVSAIASATALVMSAIAGLGYTNFSVHVNQWLYTFSPKGSFLILLSISAVMFYAYVQLTLPHVVQQYTTKRRAT